MTTTPVARPLTALDAIYTRRSVRRYTQRRLDNATVRALLDAAVQAPTARHTEPWTFAIVQDPARLQRYSDLAKPGLLDEARAAVIKHPADRTAASALAELLDPRFSVFYDATTLIIIAARPLDPFAEADCWLAAENLMLAACALGLGSCCIGCVVPTLETPLVRRELEIPDGVKIVAPIIVGEPGEMTGAAVERKQPEILSWR